LSALCKRAGRGRTLPDAGLEAHPRMDAALELLGARFIQRLPILLTWRDEVVVLEREAFGRGNRVARKDVQRWNDAAAEIIDFCEGMGFATLVDGDERVADLRSGLRRAKMPSTDGLVRRQKGDEVAEQDAAVPRARTRSDGGVERNRIARVVYRHDALQLRARGDDGAFEHGRSQQTDQQQDGAPDDSQRTLDRSHLDSPFCA